jgi:hypothetical protein
MGTIATVTIDTVDYSVYALSANAVTDADEYWGGRLGDAATAWDAASTDEKRKALVMASDWIDRSSNWTGTVTVDGQPRDWPRDNATNQCTGESITSGTTPDALASAAFWLAGQVLVDSSIVDAAGQGSNVKKAKAGSAEVTFFTPTIGSASDIRLPTVAHDYLRCFLSSSTSIIAPVGYGDDEDSFFDEDDYGLSEGLS